MRLSARRCQAIKFLPCRYWHQSPGQLLIRSTSWTNQNQHTRSAKKGVRKTCSVCDGIRFSFPNCKHCSTARNTITWSPTTLLMVWPVSINNFQYSLTVNLFFTFLFFNLFFSFNGLVMSIIQSIRKSLPLLWLNPLTWRGEKNTKQIYLKSHTTSWKGLFKLKISKCVKKSHIGC